MESTLKHPPGTSFPSSLGLAAERGHHVRGNLHQSWRDGKARSASVPEDCKHIDLADSTISAEKMGISASSGALTDPPRPSSASVDPKTYLETSLQGPVDPDSGVATDHPPSLSREPTHPSSDPPWSTKRNTEVLHNDHPFLSSSMRSGDAAPHMVPPRRSSRHYQSERLENESWRSGSTSYDGEPFSSRPSQVSDSMTLDNPTTYENSRHFPPRLPTAPPFSDTHRRSDATKKIQSWINRHERSQAARRHRDGGEEDSSYHSDDSQSSSGESITSSQGFDRGVGALWRELKVRRRRLRDLKDTMAQKRSNLKALRPKMYEADNAFMSAIRPTLVNKGTLRQTPMEEVDRRFAEMQRLRTECQDLETGYEELEDTVDGQEAQLERVEVRFFSLLGSGYDSESVAPMVAPDKALSDNVPHELRGIAAEKPVEDLHPLFVQLTLAVANLRNGQEELGNLLSMKSQCDEAVTVKKRLRQKIPKDLDDFLADFPSREASKRKEILQNEQEVSRFRQLCLEKDIMAKHMSLEMTFMFNPKSEAEDIKLADKTSILSNRETLAHPVFSTLLSQPDHLLEKPIPLTPTGALEKAVNMPDDDTRKQLKVLRAKKEMAIHSLMKDRNQGGGTAELINRWILFNLRNSPIDVVKLFTIFTSKLSVKNVLLWQRDVLHFWYRDGTGAAIDRYRDFDGDSEYYSRVGTPPRTRAASEGAGSRRLVRHHCRARSGGAVTYTAL